LAAIPASALDHHYAQEHEMDEKFGRDVVPFIFMAIFVGSMIALAVTGH
jgi:hypothetical protein